MNEKRFKMGESDIQGEMTFIDTETNKIYWQEYFDEIVDLVNEQQTIIQSLKKENEILKKIGVMYQGHNPCETCTYCLENRVCCAEPIPISCDDAKNNFIQGLCKKHKQIVKSIRKYDDEI